VKNILKPGTALKTVLWTLAGIALLLVLLFGADALDRRGDSSGASGNTDKTVATAGPADTGDLSNEGYTLEKVVVLSRHNIRSPLVSKESILGVITPHEWFAWSSPASQLSVKGGVLETAMGQYFRKWLEDEGLFPENYQPDDESVRIYANSKQRTIATARFFSSGLLPAMNEDVEYHADFDTMDPVFNPKFTFASDSYREAVEAQVKEEFGDDLAELGDNYELLEDVLDMEESDGFKDGSVTEFKTDDTEIIVEDGAEPALTGSLKNGCSASDALVLQYYEEDDPVEAGFGNDLSEEQWKDICEIKDLYTEYLFNAPLVAVNVANPLLKEMLSEMDNNEREFSFLCGHDSNLMSVMSALDTEEYELPGAIERDTPIGSKLVLTKWKSKDGEEFWDIDLVYQTADQLRDVTVLSEEDHPGVVDLDLRGLDQNSDGLYTDAAIKGRFAEAIGRYDSIKAEYK